MTERETRDEVRSPDRGGAGGQAPERPTQLPGGSWWAAIRRTVREFQIDNLKDWAAALTPYYSVLSIFPALLVLISLIDLAGPSTIQKLLDNLGQVAPARSTRSWKARSTTCARPRVGRAAGLAGLAVALWSASNYIAAFMRASNAIYDVPEGPAGLEDPAHRDPRSPWSSWCCWPPPRWRWWPPAAADRIGRLLGLGSAVVTVWGLVKRPVLLLVVSFLFALLYWASPTPNRASAGSPRAGSWPWWSGWSPRWPSRSMWPTSAPTTRPTAAWPA